MAQDFKFSTYNEINERGGLILDIFLNFPLN